MKPIVLPEKDTIVRCQSQYSYTSLSSTKNESDDIFEQISKRYSTQGINDSHQGAGEVVCDVQHCALLSGVDETWI